MRSLTEFVHRINQSTYKLDTSGVVALFGGDAAVDAIMMIHLHAGRRWVGWYNYPGALGVAMRFSQMAKNLWWDSIFPGPNETPAATFGLAAEYGPGYTGSFSRTKLPKTKYLGYLVADGCAECRKKELKLVAEDGREGRRTGNPAAVTIVSLPSKQNERTLAQTKQTAGLIPIKPKYGLLPFFAIVPSLVSIAACVFCLLAWDPLCASLILFGIVNGGISSLVLGSAVLRIRVPVPSTASPPGDGLMFPADGNVIVLKGHEADANVITKGEFELDYTTGILPHRNHHSVGFSSLLLLAQSLLQLLFVPLCTFFGQITFLASLIVSGAYHLYVVSHQKKKVHQELLFRELSLRMEKWLLGTRTQMAVFACLCVADGHSDPLRVNFDDILSTIIPNDTPVWKCWRRKVLKELEHFWEPEKVPYTPNIQVRPDDKAEEDEYRSFSDKDKELLRDLVGDAWCVFSKYPSWRSSESEIWRERVESTEEKASLLQVGSLA